MKTLFMLLPSILFLLGGFAQSPEKMSYQVVIRNSNNQLVTNHAVGLKISILQGTLTGTIVYQETYNPNLQTNANGLVSIEIGAGVPISGIFSDINWANGPYFIKTETDPAGGTNYTITGTSQLLSVPYAFYAKIAGNKFSGNYSDLTGTPDFAKWDKDSTDNVTLAGNQTIAGDKTFSGITTVKDPVNAQDAANKAYVDKLHDQIAALENKLLTVGLIIKDIDGNIYTSVRIGGQVWIAENLKTSRLNDGTPIPLVIEPYAWYVLTTPGRCYYDNDSLTYKNTYGAIYNWYTVNTGKLCPAGWHVPGESEWTVLSDYLGGAAVAGGKLKEAGTVHWQDPNSEATNESGFTALPAGYRYYDGRFSYIGTNAWWWSSSEFDTDYVWYHSVIFNAGNLEFNYEVRNRGWSVRCLKN